MDNIHTKPKKLVERFCKYFDVSVEDVKGDARPDQFVLCRDMIAYFLREKFGMTYKQISEFMGRDNHSTSLYQHKKTVEMLAVKDRLYIKAMPDLEKIYKSI